MKELFDENMWAILRWTLRWWATLFVIAMLASCTLVGLIGEG